MSTAIIDHPGASAPGRTPGPASSRRGHLRLVGEHERAVTIQRGQARELRLTPRGRLAVTTTVALVLALVAGSLIVMRGPAGATSSVVVEPGMTLTQIATEQLPEVPLSQAITDIQRANLLSTTSIAVGQELVIPAR